VPKLVSAHQAIDPPLWWALKGDTRLAGTARPAANMNFEDIQNRHRLSSVVSLVEHNQYDCLPLQRSVFPLDDLFGTAVPCDPSAEFDRVTGAVAKVRELLDQGHGVLIHCEGGTGRTGTVIGAVLVSYGVPAPEVVRWLDEVHQLRGQPGWPESPWQRDTLFAFAAEDGQSSPFTPPGTNL